MLIPFFIDHDALRYAPKSPPLSPPSRYTRARAHASGMPRVRERARHRVSQVRPSHDSVSAPKRAFFWVPSDEERAAREPQCKRGNNSNQKERLQCYGGRRLGRFVVSAPVLRSRVARKAARKVGGTRRLSTFSSPPRGSCCKAPRKDHVTLIMRLKNTRQSRHTTDGGSAYSIQPTISTMTGGLLTSVPGNLKHVNAFLGRRGKIKRKCREKQQFFLPAVRRQRGMSFTCSLDQSYVDITPRDRVPAPHRCYLACAFPLQTFSSVDPGGMGGRVG